MLMRNNFGTHLVIDFRIDDLEKLNDKTWIKVWLYCLVRDLKMEVHQIDGTDAIMVDTWGSIWEMVL